MVDAIRFVLRERDFRAGPHTVGYQSCDDSTAQAELIDLSSASNAKGKARATSPVVGVIGPYNSPCAWAQIPIANRAGPLAMISPANTLIGPDARGNRRRRTNRRSTTRPACGTTPATSLPTTSRQLRAAVLAQDLGLRAAVRAEDSRSLRPRPTVQFQQLGLGLTIAGDREWHPQAKSYTARADRVARTRPDGVYFPGPLLPESRTPSWTRCATGSGRRSC